MPASFDFIEFHQSTFNESTVDGETAFRSHDTSTGIYPIGIPDSQSSGTNYSCEILIKAHCVIAPDTAVTNFKIWKDYNPVTGVRQYIGHTSGTPDSISNGQSDWATHTCDDGYNDQATAYDWDTTNSITDIGDRTYFLVLQLGVTADAINSSFNTTTGIYHVQYDES